MRRREFLALIGSTAWSLAAQAQQGERMRRIGVLMGYAENDWEAQAWVAAFREALQSSGGQRAATYESTFAGPGPTRG
jgi:putative ABC transport system substrate-binding protein